MKVQLKVCRASQYRTWKRGEIIDVPDYEGKALILSGQAQSVDMPFADVERMAVTQFMTFHDAPKKPRRTRGK